MRRAHNRLFDQRHCFSRARHPIMECMSIFRGLGRAASRLVQLTTRVPGARAAAGRRQAAGGDEPTGADQGPVGRAAQARRAAAGARGRRRSARSTISCARTATASAARAAAAAAADRPAVGRSARSSTGRSPASSCCGWCSPPCTASRPKSAASSPASAATATRSAPGIGFTLPSPIDRVAKDRRREYPRNRRSARRPRKR